MFCDLFYFGFSLASNTRLTCNTLIYLIDEISQSYIACGMTLTMPSNLLWVSSSIALCFSCFKENILNDFLVITVRRERSSLIPVNAVSTDRHVQLVNAAIETPSVVTADAISPVNHACYCVVSSFSHPFTKLNFIKQLCPNFN